jgi:hypothetical protein
MDPVTVSAVLLAIISGVSGEAGAKLWDGLRRMISRPPRTSLSETSALTVQSDGARELAALEQGTPTQQEALALANALLKRADADVSFRQDLEAWWSHASQINITAGDTDSTITGGTQYGPVLQGRDFSGLTFNVRANEKSSE